SPSISEISRPMGVPNCAGPPASTGCNPSSTKAGANRWPQDSEERAGSGASLGPEAPADGETSGTGEATVPAPEAHALSDAAKSNAIHRSIRLSFLGERRRTPGEDLLEAAVGEHVPATELPQQAQTDGLGKDRSDPRGNLT